MIKDSKPIDNAILFFGVLVFALILLLNRDAPWFISTLDKVFSQNCPETSALRQVSCVTTQIFWMNVEFLERASATLKGEGVASDLAQDIIGFQALVRHADPYPVLGPAYQKMGLDWGMQHPSTHPPMAFLLVAPIAFLPWNLASAAWAWFMLVLLVLTFRCFGTSWKAAIGLTPLVLF